MRPLNTSPRPLREAATVGGTVDAGLPELAASCAGVVEVPLPVLTAFFSALPALLAVLLALAPFGWAPALALLVALDLAAVALAPLALPAVVLLAGLLV